MPTTPRDRDDELWSCSGSVQCRAGAIAAMLAVPLSFGATLFWLDTSSCHAVVQGFGVLKPGVIAAAEVRMHS